MSKDKLSDTLDEISTYFYGCYRNAGSGTRAFEQFHDWMCAVDDAKKRIKDATTVATDINVLGKNAGEWISVKDRLPEVDKSILYCAFGRSVGEGVYRGFNGIHHVWNMYAVSGTHLDNEVTHWMPLPEPPKEEHNDHPE